MRIVTRGGLVIGALVGVALFVALTGVAQSPSGSEWLTWGFDQERTGWNKNETTLSKANVSGLTLKWTAQLSTKPRDIALSTMTAPLVVQGVNTAQGVRTLLFVVGSDDTLVALDADTGQVAWQKQFPNSQPASFPPTWLCSNTQNSTPVIDKAKGLIFLTTSDGKLRSLSLSNGAERMPPTDFVTPFSRNWSLNLIDDVIYSSTARGCAGAIANFSAMDVSDLAHPHLSRLYTSGGRPAGAWGRGGVVKGPRGILAQTADGPFDPGAGNFGETVLALAPKELRIIGSFTVPNWRELNGKDLDLGSANGTVFQLGDRTVMATAAKEGVLYLLDANTLGGSDHSSFLYQSPRLGNDEDMLAGRGVWGAVSTALDSQGQRFVYLPMWGPPSKLAPTFKYTYGDAPRGSIMAFQIVAEGDKATAIPMWRSRDMHVPDPPVIANGVVYAIQTGENTVQFADRPAGGGVAPAVPVAPAGGRQQGAGGNPDGPAPAAPGGGGGGNRGGGAQDPAAAARAEAARAQAARFRATPVTNLVLYAYDAQTGKELYSSDKIMSSWVHFSEPVVAAGKVFVVSWDAHVYAFGLK